ARVHVPGVLKPPFVKHSAHARFFVAPGHALLRGPAALSSVRQNRPVSTTQRPTLRGCHYHVERLVPHDVSATSNPTRSVIINYSPLMMKVLMVASEAAPFAKTGGL